jgi:hypothetical protein
MKKKILIAALLGVTSAQAQDIRINVSEALFSRPLVENLATEYNRLHPGVRIEVVTTPDADGDVKADGGALNSIGRFFVLPIANSNNILLQNRKVQKGLTPKLSRQLFVERDYLETLDAQETGEKVLPGTVYSLSGGKAAITKLVAGRLQVSPSQIKGKKIIGQEENAIKVVLTHDDAISFNLASLVYDVQTGKPRQGLSVLNSDLDGDGKVSQEERDALANIATLTAYLEQVGSGSVPQGYLTIDTQNSRLQQFVSWVQQQGQEVVNRLGYLRVQQHQQDKLTAKR